ncbi:MAG: flagellar basal body P-ring protein FlgI [Desulfovermiculus sp.]
MRSKWLKVLCFLFLGLVLSCNAWSVRLKELANLQGVRSNQLIGYGLVVGLNDTGDSVDNGFTGQTLGNMLERLRITTNRNDIDVDNVAAVMVTTELPSFSKPGDTLDVVVSSLGDAESLSGGTLIQTPLSGPQGDVYAAAQGSVLVGGFSAGGEAAEVQKNHPTVGHIPEGATVEREVDFSLPTTGELSYRVSEPDFTTVSRIIDSLNAKFGSGTATARDSGGFRVQVPEEFRQNMVQFIAEVEQVHVQPGSRARVVVNERTGTIVMGGQVKLNQVAVAHGNLKLEITETPMVSQPAPFSLQGETVEVPRTDIEVEEDEAQMVVMQEGVSISDVAAGLNTIGATPRDMISILQAIKKAGALHAELEVM